MSQPQYSTPGVYIEENAFPNALSQAATAVPAFIGYTPQAVCEGKSYNMVPKKITSFAEFQSIYCLPDLPPPADPTKQYSPQYYLLEQNEKPEKGNYLQINGVFYAIVPDPNTVYYLYNMIKMFYENGGGDAYIVSVGSYGPPLGKWMEPGAQVVNANVELNKLKEGIALLKNESEPTIYIVPEATLLSVDNNGNLMQSMLLQNMEMKTNISIFDIIGGDDPGPNLFTNNIEAFRNNTGNKGLDFGAAYYPFICTTAMQSSDIDYTNLFGGDLSKLSDLINPPSNPNQVVSQIISNIKNPEGSKLTISQYHNSLLNASPTYALIMKHVLESVNIIPPSGAIAGVITTVDNQEGVWQAPANISIMGAVDLPIKLTDDQQEGLNIDAVSGKSINAIRFFQGRGILIWGARTLDGNSNDYRYLSVRRTLIMIEQSCKHAIESFVFSPNDKNTWESIKAMISSFLLDLWKQGALQGASPADAFGVECGLGTTMNNEDILSGYVKVEVKVAVLHPAEFIFISLHQEVAK